MTVITGNCLDVMRTMAPDSVDAVVTDPPYRTISGGNSIGKNGVGQYGRPTGMLMKNDGRIFKHNDTTPEEYMPEIFRVLASPGHAWVMSNEMNRRRCDCGRVQNAFSRGVDQKHRDT